MLRLSTIVLCAIALSTVGAAQGGKMLQVGPSCPPVAFGNIRGANLIIYYDTQLPAYEGTASSYVQWWLPAQDPRAKRNWGSTLDGLSNLGINYVRVWLNFFAYEDLGRSTFLSMIEEFASEAQQRCMLVEYVVWDSRFDPPDDPAAHFEGWTASPGETLVQDPDFWPDRGQVYVTDVASAMRDNPNVVFDVMNEPGPPYWPLCDATATLIRQHNPTAEITLGFAAMINTEDPTAPFYIPRNIVPHPAVTHYTYHPYCVSYELFEMWTDQARALVASRAPGAPLKIGEQVGVTELQSYETALIYNLRYAQENSIPTIPWVYMQGAIPYEGKPGPFTENNGMVYIDGTVRDLPGMLALQWFARYQEPTIQLAWPTLKPWTDPRHHPYVLDPLIPRFPRGEYDLMKALMPFWSLVLVPLDDSNAWESAGYEWRKRLLGHMTLDAMSFRDLPWLVQGVLSPTESAALIAAANELQRHDLQDCDNLPYLEGIGWVTLTPTGELAEVRWHFYDDLFDRHAATLAPIIQRFSGWF